MTDRDNYPIYIDGRWSLEDLYVFSRTYEQVYFAVEAITPASDGKIADRINNAFAAFPWQGGYSAVNFYNQLKYATPPKKRPTVESIRYASPGVIELALYVSTAGSVAFIVHRVAKSIELCNHVYNQIHTDLQNRKLLRIDVRRKEIELEREEIALVEYHTETMAKMMGLENVQTIHERTKNPLISLKILLSLYRRIRTLAEYSKDGKARLEAPKE